MRKILVGFLVLATMLTLSGCFLPEPPPQPIPAAFDTCVVADLSGRRFVAHDPYTSCTLAVNHCNRWHSWHHTLGNRCIVVNRFNRPSRRGYEQED